MMERESMDFDQHCKQHGICALCGKPVTGWVNKPGIGVIHWPDCTNPHSPPLKLIIDPATGKLTSE